MDRADLRHRLKSAKTSSRKRNFVIASVQHSRRPTGRQSVYELGFRRGPRFRLEFRVSNDRVSKPGDGVVGLLLGRLSVERGQWSYRASAGTHSAGGGGSSDATTRRRRGEDGSPLPSPGGSGGCYNVTASNSKKCPTDDRKQLLLMLYPRPGRILRHIS